MKKILFILLFTLSVFAQSEIKNEVQSCVDNNTTTAFSDSTTVEKRGCCSWHGGVRGCSGGTVVCNDGTYSPSCTCLGGQPIIGTKVN